MFNIMIYSPKAANCYNLHASVYEVQGNWLWYRVVGSTVKFYINISEAVNITVQEFEYEKSSGNIHRQ